MLVHASAAMTLDVSPSRFDGDLDAVADRLDDATRSSRRDRADLLRPGPDLGRRTTRA